MTLADALNGATWFGALVLLALAVASVGTKRVVAAGRVVLAVVLVLATTALAVRWAGVGHPPMFGTFENTYAAAWFVLAACTLAAFAPRMPAATRDLWRLGAPWVAALLLYGSRFRSAAVPLTISEQSLWVEIHVVFAWLAFVPLLLAGAMAVLLLLRRAPLGMTPEVAEERMTRLLLVGYVALTAMLVTGSIYLFILFGTLWQWEIVETLSLMTWLAYGLTIHGRLFYRWNGRWFQLTLALILPLLLAAYFVWSVFPATFHYFDIPLVRPY